MKRFAHVQSSVVRTLAFFGGLAIAAALSNPVLAAGRGSGPSSGSGAARGLHSAGTGGGQVMGTRSGGQIRQGAAEAAARGNGQKQQIRDGSHVDPSQASRSQLRTHAGNPEAPTPIAP